MFAEMNLVKSRDELEAAKKEKEIEIHAKGIHFV